MSIDVLLESSGVLAVRKPAGLPTQAPPGIASVESLVRQHRFGEALASAQASGQRRHPGGFLGVPHRLDRPVSGVLLLATTPRAARQLSRQFERRQIRKTYLAVVSSSAAGLVAGQAFEWRDTIGKVPDEPRASLVPKGTVDGREGLTAGHVLAVTGGRAVVVLEPLTGRMHQLRVQAASRGMPVLGDFIYGAAPIPTEHDDRSSPIALHAWRIRYTDPDTAASVQVECPPPPGPLWDEWLGLLDTASGVTR